MLSPCHWLRSDWGLPIDGRGLMRLAYTAGRLVSVAQAELDLKFIQPPLQLFISLFELDGGLVPQTGLSCVGE